MALPRLIGLHNMYADRDDVGHRTYTVEWKVANTSTLDGPANVFANWITIGLPAVGSTYSVDGDADPWAYCTPSVNIAPSRDHAEGDPHQTYIVTQKWTTNPSWRCQTLPIENPLLEPWQVSGAFVHEQRSPTVDMLGAPLIYPNYEPITGPIIEQKYSYPSISITFNSATLPLSTYTLLVNKVNDATLWGLPKRCVRFVDASWERLVYGTCNYYFRCSYTFEMDVDSFDRPIPATGNLCLADGGMPLNPKHYIQYKDSQGENAVTMLDFEGRAVTDPSQQYIMRPQVAKEGNLLLLGIPSSLN